MDSIILAAGENVRMQPHLPAHHKPLLWYGDETLIAQCVRRAREADGRIVIVAAPSNVAAIVEVVNDDDISYVVQPRATGPHDALRRALPLTMTDNVCILMGDNVIPPGVVQRTVEYNMPAICVRRVSAADAPSFTWTRGVRWYDKAASLSQVDAWIGPLVLPRGIVDMHGGWLSKFEHVGGMIQLREECLDIGTPQRLREALRA